MLIVSQDLGVNKVVQENWELNVYIKIVIVSKLNGKRGPINSSTPPNKWSGSAREPLRSLPRDAN